MGQFVNGEWKPGWYEPGADGSFVRPPTTFRHRIAELQEARYHLYAAWACPWAHRVLIARSVLGLQSKISVSMVDWFLDDDGWRFHPEHPGSTPDHLYGSRWLRELYLRADRHYTGRVTVPVLWDRKLQGIVNNESRELLRMLATTCRPWHAPGAPDLSPEPLRSAIDAVLDALYQPINNGVYRCGFAKTQSAYEQAVESLFTALEHWNEVLREREFLVGEQLTEADICLFTTLLRFDPVYHVHFKCSAARIADYPHLQSFLERVYAWPGVAETCHLGHIVRHYFCSHRDINPAGLVACLPKRFFLTSVGHVDPVP